MSPEEIYNPISAPRHYLRHPSGVECITITEHLNFCLGNAVKYIWRSSEKGGTEDLQKARWYLDREIALRLALEREITHMPTATEGNSNAS